MSGRATLLKGATFVCREHGEQLRLGRGVEVAKDVTRECRVCGARLLLGWVELDDRTDGEDKRKPPLRRWTLEDDFTQLFVYGPSLSDGEVVHVREDRVTGADIESAARAIHRAEHPDEPWELALRDKREFAELALRAVLGRPVSIAKENQ